MTIEIPKDVKTGGKWITGFRSVQEWLDEVYSEKTGSDKTIVDYKIQLWKFCLWADMTPVELLSKAEEELKKEAAGHLKRKTWAEKLVLKYFKYLVTETKLYNKSIKKTPKLARTTAKMRYGVIRSFFRYSGVQFKGKTPQATSRTKIYMPTDEELTKAWKAAPLQEKLPLGILRSTGMRPQDAIMLTYGDVRQDLERNSKRIYIEKVSEKEDLPFAVCLTQETTEVLNFIINQRKTVLLEKFTDETKIFQYGYDNLWNYVKGAGKRVGIKLMPKLFRKMFRTKCSPIIGRDAVQKMAAWKIPGAGKHYFLPSREETEKLYEKIEYLLTFEKPKLSTDVTAQRKVAWDMLKAAGFDPEILLKKARIKGAAREAKFLTEEVGKLLRKRIEPAGGGRAFETMAQDSLAKIFLGAIKKVKEELKDNNDGS